MLGQRVVVGLIMLLTYGQSALASIMMMRLAAGCSVEKKSQLTGTIVSLLKEQSGFDDPIQVVAW